MLLVLSVYLLFAIITGNTGLRHGSMSVSFQPAYVDMSGITPVLLLQASWVGQGGYGFWPTALCCGGL